MNIIGGRKNSLEHTQGATEMPQTRVSELPAPKPKPSYEGQGEVVAQPNSNPKGQDKSRGVF